MLVSERLRLAARRSLNPASIALGTIAFPSQGVADGVQPWFPRGAPDCLRRYLDQFLGFFRETPILGFLADIVE
jgi:hypothetical protein